MEDTISRKEHEEFARRIEAEDNRQNKRIEALESMVRKISDLTASIKELSVTMQNMLTEIEKQGERLESLEERDGEKWRTVTSHIITLLVGAVVTYLLSRIGI